MNNPSTEHKDWFKDRGYLHLTNRISKVDRLAAEKYIKSTKNVVKHRFSPFILRQTTTRRYKYSKDLGRRSHKSVDDKGNLVSNAKVRPIMYATHIDSNIYSYYSQKIIQPKYEAYLKNNALLNNCVTAYRQIDSEDEVRFKYNVDFAKEVFDEVKDRGECAVLALDIENFFPTLDHSQLKKIWSKILGTKTLPEDHYSVFKSITNYSYFYYDDLRKRRKGHLDEKKIAHLKNQGKFQFFNDYKDFEDSGIQVYKNQSVGSKKISGIPQGLPISAMLANLYMLPFDESVIENLVQIKGCYYRRYSDDLVVICNTKDVDDVEQFVLTEIKKIALSISPSKTEKFQFKFVDSRLSCYKIENGGLVPNSYLQYLGFDFYGYKTLIKAANLSRFYREMKQSMAIKAKRIETVQQKYLTDDSIIYKRKIYRLYSFRGIQSRELPASKTIFQDGKLVNKKFTRKYRGNFIKYAYRASDIMEAPEIKRQLRHHMIILKNYMRKFSFENGPE
ncbi:RNA-directed DNA polymerase (Reverse transcriptase) [Dokdonia sinensis]|uniref:RNA-directed DNA polymerase (Reverse transcriptase) n=1 Tax=Dokdonia sinensis TaxID=2479847 RepID=A0A3M0G154_9FLAO|nr:reverse transcriptase domain-containing protein [Dokdonia sinensis]RMB58485.1 RNA-directed DNA polymerase (Reverse transcriptase) [Dokdonia sinensis]